MTKDEIKKFAEEFAEKLYPKLQNNPLPSTICDKVRQMLTSKMSKELQDNSKES